MAKKKAAMAAGSGPTGDKPMKKSTAVREIMATGVKEIKEIQKQVKEKYGLDVNYQNVYVLLKKSGKPGRKKTVARGKKKATVAASSNGPKLGAFSAGVQFIKAAGSMQEAKAVLQAIEEIRSL